MDAYAAPELFVQVLDAGLIFRVGLDIYILAHEVGDIGYQLGVSPLWLHEYLGCDILWTACHDLLLVFGGDGYLIGYEVYLA